MQRTVQKVLNKLKKKNNNKNKHTQNFPFYLTTQITMTVWSLT